MLDPLNKIIGVEPQNAESMTLAIKNDMPTKLEKVDVCRWSISPSSRRENI